MTTYSSQDTRSSCDKFMQMMKNILKLSSFLPPLTDGRSSSSLSPPHRHHPPVKQPKNKTRERPKTHHVNGLDGGRSSSLIKIQGIDHHDAGRVDNVMNRHESMQTSELKTSITNLKVSDYIKRFHERNKHEAGSLVLSPPPPPPHIFFKK